MSTATIDPPQEQLVTPLEGSWLYMSRRSGLRLTMKSRYPIRNPVTGQPDGNTRGIYVGFRDGMVRIPREGSVVLVDTLDGGESEEIPVADVLAWLDRHRLNGNREEGFWRVDPTAPPVSQEEQGRVTKAAEEWDVETLQAIIDQERAGWQREQIIQVAQGSIDRIRAREAELEEREREALEAQQRAEAAAAERIAAAEQRAADAEERAKAAEKKAAKPKPAQG